MKWSFQELLLNIPLHLLSFLAPVPKEHIYFEAVSETVPDGWLKQPTLLVPRSVEESEKLNDREMINRLIQDSNLAAIVLAGNNHSLNENTIGLFGQCLLPIVQIDELSPADIYEYFQDLSPFYSQISEELVGFFGRDFADIADQLAIVCSSPLLYYDENQTLLLETGKEEEIREAKRWFNTNMRAIHEKGKTGTVSPEHSPFEAFPINVGGFFTQTLVLSSDLAEWQKKFVYKFTGLSALVLQTKGIIQEQQEKLMEHFVYDLLYHKFESHKEMVRQGKHFGWNLERPHHLMILQIEWKDGHMTNMDWMNDILASIGTFSSSLKENIIVFPFQDQIVVLLEDGLERSMNDRKNYVFNISRQLLAFLSNLWPDNLFKIGIGKWYQDTVYLNKSYQEANLALQFGQIWQENNQIYHIYDLGILRLLMYIHQEILFDFSNEYLSLLEESDEKNGTEYIKTLKSYIQHQGVINDVSESLHVHPNTLRNRIKKMEEITGIDFQDAETFINLVIAVKILSLKKQW